MSNELCEFYLNIEVSIKRIKNRYNCDVKITYEALNTSGSRIHTGKRYIDIRFYDK